MSNNKFKVLVVEDEANICSFIETLLETNGYQALVANTCAMGQTLFTSHNPDLIILDLGLPDRDGLELIRFVRQKFLTPIAVLHLRHHPAAEGQNRGDCDAHLRRGKGGIRRQRTEAAAKAGGRRLARMPGLHCENAVFLLR